MEGVNAYAFGTTIKLTAALTDDAGQPVPASSLRVRVQRASGGAETELALTAVGGVATASWTPDAAGFWFWRAFTDGPPAVAAVRLVEVEPSPLGPPP